MISLAFYIVSFFVPATDALAADFVAWIRTDPIHAVKVASDWDRAFGIVQGLAPVRTEVFAGCWDGHFSMKKACKNKVI